MSKFNLSLDASQISEYLNCPLKWWYKYNENLQLATTSQKVAADKGTLIHHLMDLYYTQRALNPELNKLEQANEAINTFKLNKVTNSLFQDDDGTLEDFICKRFMLYIQRYLNDDFIVQVNNKEVGVEVGFSNLLYENEDVRFILTGRLDLLNIIGGNIQCWTDHKTEGKYNPLYPYKVQFKTYALATSFEYGMANYIGMQEDKDNKLLRENKLFRRDLIHFPFWVLHEWKNKLIGYFYEIYKVLKSERPEKEFYKIRNEGACSGAFDSNPCQFTHLCEEQNWGMKQRIKEFKYTKKEPWFPWSLKDEKIKQIT